MVNFNEMPDDYLLQYGDEEEFEGNAKKKGDYFELRKNLFNELHKPDVDVTNKIKLIKDYLEKKPEIIAMDMIEIDLDSWCKNFFENLNKVPLVKDDLISVILYLLTDDKDEILNTFRPMKI